MPALEVMLRTAAVLSCLLLAGLLLGAGRRHSARWLGALYCLGVAAFVLTSAREAGQFLGHWRYPLVLLCVTKAAWFWLFAKSLFADDFRLRPAQLGIVASVGVYGLWQQLAYVPAARSGLVTAGERAAALGFELLVLALVVLALIEAWRGLAGDLVELRRRLRLLFVTLVAGYLGMAVLVQVYNALQGASTPPPLALANLALITLFSLAAAMTLVQPRRVNWMSPEPRPVQVELGDAERRLLAALQRAMETERIYREEGLTIGALARRLDTREHVLRQVINRGLGFRNFNDFLHAHRIGEAARRLRRPEDARLPVLSIALDVGYGSIGPFNRAFKARVGMTPTRFRRQAGAGD